MLKSLTSFLLILIIISQVGCAFNPSSERKAYAYLKQGIIDGKVYKGMTVNEIISNFGRPSESIGPTIFNGIKTQVLIYKLSPIINNGDKTYYLYFTDGKLKEWKEY